MDRLLCKVREEAGSKELGEPKHVDTPGGYESRGPGQGQMLYGDLSGDVSRICVRAGSMA